MKSKNLFLIVSLNSGGLENYLLRFVSHYQNDFEAYVICKSGKSGSDLVNDFEQLGVTIIPLKLSYFNFLAYIKFFKLLKTEKYDCICDFTGNFAALPLLTAKLAGIKKRVAFYRGSSNHFKEDGFRLLYNKLMNYIIPYVSTSILANSREALNFFFKNKWKDNPNYEVIYNGINASPFFYEKENLRNELNIPSNAFVTGHVGRYNQAKNHKTIIEVAVQLCKLDSNIYFIFCGKDTEIYLKDRVLQEGLENQIKLLGMRKDVIKVLNTLDCFYFPSLTEGQPNALIEALVAGLPFVASNIEPHKETIPDSHYEQLINPLDVESAIKKIVKIKESESYAKSLILKEWAIEKFNAKTQFGCFFEKLK
jgi:glycosyltransferase involved in cell wall biosynthesis